MTLFSIFPTFPNVKEAVNCYNQLATANIARSVIKMVKEISNTAKLATQTKDKQQNKFFKQGSYE